MQGLARLLKLTHAILLDGTQERFVRGLISEETFRPDGGATLLVYDLKGPRVAGAGEAIDLNLDSDAFVQEETRQLGVLKLTIWDRHGAPPHMLMSGMSLERLTEPFDLVEGDETVTLTQQTGPR